MHFCAALHRLQDKIPRRKQKTPFLDAIRTGDIEAVKDEWYENVDALYEKDPLGGGPLHVAVDGENLVVAKWLVRRRRFPPNKSDHNGETPLFYACLYGYVELAKWLVEDEGVRVKYSVNRQGDTLLHAAAKAGSLDLVRWLVVKQRMGVDVCNNDKWTALHYASYYDHIEVAAWLMKHRARVKAKTREGERAIGLSSSPRMKALLKTGALPEEEEEGSERQPRTVKEQHEAEKAARELEQGPLRVNDEGKLM